MQIVTLQIQITNKKKEKIKKKRNMGFTDKQEALVNSSFELFKQNPGNSVLFYTM
jgi:hypothetical protein